MTKSGLLNLICTIVESGMREKDTVYFESEIFEIHCKLAGLDPQYVRRKALKAMKDD